MSELENATHLSYDDLSVVADLDDNFEHGDIALHVEDEDVNILIEMDNSDIHDLRELLKHVRHIVLHKKAIEGNLGVEDYEPDWLEE